MAPKKAGKANKLAKMSDEERARYLQHRADIEEEARRRKQELVSRFMKNKLNKEDVFSRINLAKINQNWRQILRKIKIKDMQQELQMMIESFARMTDTKNAVISRLMMSLEEAEDQYSRMLQSHMEMISHFLSICGDRLKFFHDNFEGQKDELVEQWEDDLQGIEFRHKESEYNLKIIIHQQEENIEQYMKKNIANSAFILNRTDMQLQQELNEMRSNKELQLEKIWNEMRAVFVDFVQHHEPKIEHYQLLRERDSTYRKEINQLTDQLLTSTDAVSHYQNEWEILNREIEIEAKNSKLKLTNLQKLFNDKKRIALMRDKNEKEKLTTLSVESSKAVETLETILIKVKKLVKFESSCQKYEMDGEKVLPWNEMDLHTTDEPDALEKFWFKMGRVTLHTSALKAECDSLKLENKHLKDCLKNFLMEAALGDVKGQNTELAGRPASMKMFKLSSHPSGGFEPLAKRPVTCIEGCTSNAILHEKRLNKWRLQEQHAQKIQVRRYCW